MKFNFNKYINESFDFNSAVRIDNTTALNDVSLYSILKTITLDNIDDNWDIIRKLSPEILNRFLNFSKDKIKNILTTLILDYSIDAWEEDEHDIDDGQYQLTFKYSIYTFLDDISDNADVTPDLDTLIMAYALYQYNNDFNISLMSNYEDANTISGAYAQYDYDIYELCITYHGKILCSYTNSDVLNNFMSVVEELGYEHIRDYNS